MPADGVCECMRRGMVTNNAITAHIRRIRDKIQEIDPDFNAIRTEYGMGYRWQA